MDMIDELAAAATDMEFELVAFFGKAEFLGHPLSGQNNLPQERLIGFGRVIHRFNVLFRDDQKVNRGFRVNVFENDNAIIFPDDIS